MKDFLSDINGEFFSMIHTTYPKTFRNGKRSEIMDMRNAQMQRQGESGNVLFLILIAVVLFAALSYAVTQSSRSGGGDVNGEKSLVSSAQLTQYPAGVRTSIVRMLINGVDVENLVFDAPSNFGTSSGQIDDTSSDVNMLNVVKSAVFHPKGGGATYSAGPADLMVSGNQSDWIFSGSYEVQNIGTTVASSPAGNDIIAFLIGLNSGVCKKLNEQLGISGGTDGDNDGIPAGGLASLPDRTTDSMVFDSSTTASTGIPDEVGVISGPFTGQPYGCFDADDGNKNSGGVYYHVLVER